MEIVGYILLAIGVVGLFGNLTGAGGAGDPSPSSANARFGCFAIFLAAGGLLVWQFGSS